MELQTDTFGLLDLVSAPGFCVKDSQIVKVNSAAKGLFFLPGTDVRELIQTGAEEYAQLRDGCLYLSLTCQGNTWGASVTRCKDGDIFLLEQPSVQPELQALALAARELRSPLNSTMLIADQLLRQQDPEQTQALSRLNRGLYQLLRVVDNMSDAQHWYAGSCKELCNICAVMEEILSKAQHKLLNSGVTVSYNVPEEPIYTLCSPEQLERAILNMLSNSVKFTPKGGSIDISLSRQENLLRLSVLDSGSTIADDILSNIFTRYRRQPIIEDSRHGIGLGMVLIRNAATNHGGTVLVDRPSESGTRITITLAIHAGDDRFSTPITRPISGGYDPGLIQLSEVLPAGLYGSK